MSVRSRRDLTEGNAVRLGGAIAAILEDKRRDRVRGLDGHLI
jgi:starvation-inducible outer membrane lipoprotein